MKKILAITLLISVMSMQAGGGDLEQQKKKKNTDVSVTKAFSILYGALKHKSTDLKEEFDSAVKELLNNDDNKDCLREGCTCLNEAATNLQEKTVSWKKQFFNEWFDDGDEEENKEKEEKLPQDSKPNENSTILDLSGVDENDLDLIKNIVLNLDIKYQDQDTIDVSKVREEYLELLKTIIVANKKIVSTF